MSQPGFFFYTGDWLKDTRVLSPAVRGAWIDLLCVMHENGGEIYWTMDDLAQFWVVSLPECNRIVTDLYRLKIADVTIESQGLVRVVCRKMKKAVLAKEASRLRKQKQREKVAKYRASHAPVTRDSTGSSSSSSSSSSLNLNLKEQGPASPEPAAALEKSEPKKLDPRIKALTDKIYNHDPVRFQKLIIWVYEAEKYNWSTESIVATLTDFLPRIGLIKNWYAYLNEVIKAKEPKLSARASEAEHQRKKEETRETANEIFLNENNN